VKDLWQTDPPPSGEGRLRAEWGARRIALLPAKQVAL